MKFFISTFTIFLFFINPANSEQKVAFIDMDRVIFTSKPGSSIVKQLNDINNKNLISLKKIEDKLKEKEKTIKSQKNIISETDFQNKVNELKSEITNYKQTRKNIIEDFDKLKIDSTNKLLKFINPIIVNFSNNMKISIILQRKNIVMGNNDFDITDEIVKIVNADIKEFKIK